MCARYLLINKFVSLSVYVLAAQTIKLVENAVQNLFSAQRSKRATSILIYIIAWLVKNREFLHPEMIL